MKNSERQKVRSAILNSGDVLQSRYRILHQPHKEFSRIYLAEDLNCFEERYVLKQFTPQLKQTHALEQARQLFERKAGIFYRLQHPQVPQLKELLYYKQQKEYLFLVREYIEGETYRTILDRRIRSNNRFSEEEIRQLLTHVLPILEYIHSMGVIHRNILPDNLILRSKDKLPVLINFSCLEEIETKIQSQLQEAIVSTTRPLISMAVETGYAPPEQSEDMVYAHNDLYALAATAVVSLTGKEPKQLIDPRNYRWHWCNEDSQVTVSSKLEWILSMMLSPHPVERFCSAAEVSKILQDSFVSLSLTENTTNLDCDREKPTAKALSIANLQAQSLLFIPLIVTLVLGGYLCWKIANLETSKTIPIEADSQLKDSRN